MERQLAFAKRMRSLNGASPHQTDNMLAALRADDELMAELMALCARPRPAANDSDWEFVGVTDDPMVQNTWLHGGSGLPTTHYLPDPNQPTEP